MVTNKQMESFIAFISPPQVNLLARQKRSVAPNQKRDCKSKSRTGCITCRTRRVKCDERRPSCLRCEKAEFDCEGYALPVKLVDGDAVWQLGKGPRRLVAPNANPQWAPLDETEVGYFDLFRHQLIVDLAGHNQEDFWSRVVLCESARDESVRQSIVALGALSQALFFMPQPTGIVPSATRPLSSQEVLNHHHKAAIHHHTQAIKLFRKRIRPENATRSARSTMVMTLLLVTFEFLQGNMKAADHLMIGGIQLLRNDLRLLREAAGLLRPKREGDELEDIEHMLPKLSVASSVTHFCDLQSLQFAVLRSDGLGDLPDADCRTSLPKLLALWSDFSTRVLVFTCQAFRHQLLRIEHDTAGTEVRQTQLLVRLRRWRTVLDQYRASTADNETIQSAIRMLMPHWLMLYVFNSCVLDPTDLLYDQFEPEFREINARCAEILSMTATDGTAEPFRNKIHFSLGDGLIMPLAVVIGKCRDHDVRMEAAEMFRLLPREAAWDAQALTIGKLGLVLLEERARAVHGYIPSTSRWFWTGGEWDTGNRALHSRYLRIVPAEDGSPITQAMTMDLDSLPNICAESRIGGKSNGIFQTQPSHLQHRNAMVSPQKRRHGSKWPWLRPVKKSSGLTGRRRRDQKRAAKWRREHGGDHRPSPHRRNHQRHLKASHPIFIDKEGELRLVVSTAGRSTTFVVCPRTLARASGVWRQKIYGEVYASHGEDPSSPWTIEVSDDVSLGALTLLLYITHKDDSKIPALLGTTVLRDLILAAEIYDMVSELSPFIARWLRTVPGNPFSPRQLWIPWSLGHEALFLETARELVLCVSVDDNGRMHVPGHAGRDLELKLEEMDIAEQLRALHRDTLADILRLLLTTIEHLERERPKLGPAHEDCQSAILGRIVRELVQHGLWPLADIQLDRSIETTLSIIRRIQLPQFLDGDLHHGCSRVVDDMKKHLNRFETVTLQLKPSQALHLQNQARETGLDEPRNTPPQKSGEAGTNHNQSHTQFMMEIVEISDDD